MRYLVLAVVMLGLVACGRNPVEDKAFNQRVRGYLLEHPEILLEMSDRLRAKQQQDAMKTAVSAIRENRVALERDRRDFVVNPNGKITVVEFYDYQCGYCKLSAPTVVQLIRDNPDVRFVFKEFVIFGPTSEYAAKMVLAVKDPAKRLKLYQGFMAEKPLSEEAVDRIVTQNGLDLAALKVEIQKPEYANHLKDVDALAHKLGLTGTPAFIVGDTLIPGADVDALKKAVAAAKR